MSVNMAQSALLMQAAGAGISAAGAYSQSRGAQAGLEYQAAVARNNAQLAEWQAQDALSRGRRAEQQTRLRTAQLKGTQRATLAARGLDLGEGSALNILTDTDVMGEVDALTERDNAAREAWALRQQAAGFSADSEALRRSARGVSPGLSAASSLLAGAGSVADSWYRSGKAGDLGTWFKG